MRNLLLLATLALPLGFIEPSDASAADARLVRAQIKVDGEVILQTSTSDDGHPDVDQVWAYLEDLRFAPTEAFAPLLEERELEGDTIVLKRGEKEDWLRIEIAYGGRAELWELSLTRDGETWKLRPKQIQSAGERRWIRRYAVEGLSKKSGNRR